MSINSAYVAKYKPDPAGAITVEFSGDKRRAMLGLVRSVLEPVELLETTLRSAGKNANGLSAWAVRYYRHLARICSVYMRLCVQELRARIQSMVSGEYCLVLLPVSDAAEVEFGASGSGSGSTSAAVVSSSSTIVRGSVLPLARAMRSVSVTKSVSAGSKPAMSAVNGEHSSAALVTGGTAAMSILYAIHPHEGSSDMESMTFSVDIDAVAQEIQRVCTGAASDDAALASLLSKTVEQLTYLDGVCEVHKRLRYSAPGARESSRACGSTESAQGDEGHVHDGGLMYPVELANLKDKNRVAEEERKSRIWWRSSA
ncbi:hypothetical protein PC121_g8314 [Phytophthora cactorum]|nr:hypothetical protein PC121_g8314 [Phytophthora cactorum]KAG4062845.1 hypothetical protein PC123_g2310 [Phytophthora cactorum]